MGLTRQKPVVEAKNLESGMAGSLFAYVPRSPDCVSSCFHRRNSLIVSRRRRSSHCHLRPHQHLESLLSWMSCSSVAMVAAFCRVILSLAFCVAFEIPHIVYQHNIPVVLPGVPE